MNEELIQEEKTSLDAQLELMSREELVLAIKELTKRAEEISSGARLLMTHLKVLCHKNGGKLTYTKDEYEATIKAEPDLGETYGIEDGKEVCIVRVQTSNQE
jgi:hypothetical protein